jgi:hypothetical protein
VFETGHEFTLTEAIALGAVSLSLVAAGAYVVLRIRRQPKDKEQRRRLLVNLHGRLGDATITDAADSVLYYEYSVRGVTYTASQDISQLRQQIATDLEQLIGRPASLKYSPQNPANSILLCEEWSGLRAGAAPPAGAVPQPGSV